MPTSAQGASIYFGGTQLTEVIEYSVEANVSLAQHGDFGQVTVRAMDNAVPWSSYGAYKTLSILHGGNYVFRGGCVLERIKIDARRNDILYFSMVFRIVYPSRLYPT